MKKGKLLTEGQAKRFYETDQSEWGILEFSNPATAEISATLFKVLESKGVATHFEKLLSDGQMLVKRLAMIPIKVTIRNRLTGEMARLFGMEEGTTLVCPVYELHYKSKNLGDPLINDYHLLALKMATEEELRVIRERSFQGNHVLKQFFEEKNLELVDFQLQFGRAKGKVLLGDEISSNTCHLWDVKTGKKFEKDLFS